MGRAKTLTLEEQRSKIMASVRSKDTGPELLVRSLLHRAGYRFRLHRGDLPGKPDIVFPGRRKVIFVHGCFWHAHACRYGRPPKSKLDFWLPKLDRNKKRDAENERKLKNAQWAVLVVWQCETKDTNKLRRILGRFLGRPGPGADRAKRQRAVVKGG